MQDTGQQMEVAQLMHELTQRDSQIYHLQAQLRHFQSWTACLANAALQPLNMPVMLAAIQVVVSGFPEGTTERELALFFNDVIAANRAAVAPGPAVSDCKLMHGSQGVAILELRCSVEASNCMAFDGVQFKSSHLTVQRPRDYCPDLALLLGPSHPDPAVLAALSHTEHQQLGPTDHGRYSSLSAAGASNRAPAHSSSHGQVPAKYTADGTAYSQSSRMLAMQGALVAPPAEAIDAGSGSSSAGMQDLAPAADQGKQDEVFIGGLPSHWKAQQVKDLLAPYGQLKSLSVAMDAATGKNKGYAFVVFADSVIVQRAIEELDCKVVEGKILAVQRATEGKAAFTSSLGKDSNGSSHHPGLSSFSSRAAGGSQPGMHQQKQLQNFQQRHNQHQRASSGSSSSGSSNSSAGGFASMCPATARHGGHAAGQPSAGMDRMLPMQQQRRQHPASSAAGAADVCLQQPPAPMRPAAGVSPGDGVALGQRLLAAVTAGAAASAASAAGASNGSKQYDVNELYIGDLPLSWDEDAVRRLLGRYGKIKYFTLRNGRDKNFAFCKFKDSSVVDAAIQGLHGKIVDGYFLNVRRAIEGKQQQQQPWQGRQGMNGPPAAAAAGNGRMSYASRFGQLQTGPQQQQSQQQQQSKGAVQGGPNRAYKAEATAAAAAGRAAGDKPVQQKAEHIPMEAAQLSDACAPATADVMKQELQRKSGSTASTAPSPPRTPTAASLQQTQAGASDTKQQTQAATSDVKQQKKNASPDALSQQQKQQQQAPQQQTQPPLFLSSSGPASWGAPGLFTAVHQQEQQQQQQSQQQSSLLQTWDMLSPWSLFSGNTSKVQW